MIWSEVVVECLKGRLEKAEILKAGLTVDLELVVKEIEAIKEEIKRRKKENGTNRKSRS